jgi:hypothetical protein
MSSDQEGEDPPWEDSESGETEASSGAARLMNDLEILDTLVPTDADIDTPQPDWYGDTFGFVG